MSGTPYQQGNAVILDAAFFVGSTPTDPTTVTFRVRNPDGTLTSLIYNADEEVTRLGPGSYECALGAPAEAGQYHYEAVGTGACQATIPGEFYVIPSSVDVPVVAPGPVMGPNRTWINGEDLTNCPGFDPATQAQLGDAAAVAASMTLYELSGRQFAGVSNPVTVRPVKNDGCGCWGDFQWGGYTWVWLDGVGGWAWASEGADPLYGCGYVSRVKLSGYPIRSITEVKIGGEVLPTAYSGGAPTYRLDEWRYLTRMTDPDQPQLVQAWPGCQNVTLDDTQPATFSVTYTYGSDPPPAGIEAARQLACQVMLAQSGKPCQLPVGASKITKQGVTVDRGLLASWGRDPKTGAWATGLSMVDMFLNTYNPRGLRRRPAIIDPSTGQYAPRLGEQSV